MGLGSFRYCSGMNDCIYICSYGSRRVGFFCLTSVMMSLILPYSCLQLRLCSE
jgi:hypothetical protein